MSVVVQVEHVSVFLGGKEVELVQFSALMREHVECVGGLQQLVRQQQQRLVHLSM